MYTVCLHPQETGKYSSRHPATTLFPLYVCRSFPYIGVYMNAYVYSVFTFERV